VVDKVREAGDLPLLANTRDSLASLTYLVGTMPGFGTDEIGNFTNYCDALTAGLWTYPNLLFPQNPVPAGTYRLKFVTDASSTPGRLIGWGGDGSTALTVPVLGARMRYGTDTATDLVVTFPVSGNYDFVFDERRLTITITPTPVTSSDAKHTAASGVTRPTRRPR
jgi:hypothetical protein